VISIFYLFSLVAKEEFTRTKNDHIDMEP